MRIPIFFLLFICYLPITSAQNNLQRSYGGVGSDRGHAVITTSDGNFALAGYTNSFGAGGQDIVLLKVNPLGAILWQKTYGGPPDEFGQGIILKETTAGELLVTGLKDGDDSHVSDFFLFKTDAQGNLIWDYTYDSGPENNSGDLGRGLLCTTDGNILVFGTDDANTFGSNDGLIIKVDGDGNLLWKQVFGGEGNDHLHDAVELPGGNTLVCGSSESFEPGGTDGYLLKLDQAGNLLWSRTYGGSNLEGFNGCSPTSDYGIVMTGLTTSYGAGGWDVLLSKADSSGNLLWTKTFGGPMDERGVSVKALPNDAGYMILAFTEAPDNGDRDILLIRTDINGNLVWSRIFGTNGTENVNDWANTGLTIQDNLFACTGWSDSLTVAGEDILFLSGTLDGSVLCDDADIATSSPNMQMESPETNTASPGTYTATTTETNESSLSRRDLCYCSAECYECEKAIIHYDLNDCYSNMTDGSNMDYSEFVPNYVNMFSYAAISASNIFRENPTMNKHSCTPGVQNSPGMCVGALNSCVYSPGHLQSVVFEVQVVPDPDSAVRITSLTFFEKAPTTYDWIGGSSGLNNYPTLYAVRVLKNGTEIFLTQAIPTTVDAWLQDSVDFTEDDDFIATEITTFRFELLAYCLIGNGAIEAVWDLDDIRLFAGCEAITQSIQRIGGYVRNENGAGLDNVNISITDNLVSPSIEIITYTNNEGYFTTENGRIDGDIFITASNNTHVLNGVSTLDLIYIQKHILGISPFASPYQFIAADINRSHSVSVLDLITLQQLLLGKIHSFPNNESWRFFDAADEAQPGNPWALKEHLEYPDLNIDIGNAHFTGIKIGDVTNDAVTSINHQSELFRSVHSNIWIDEKNVSSGQSTSIDVKCDNCTELTGFQLSLDLGDVELENVTSETIEITPDNIHYGPDGILNISWHQSYPVNLSNTDCLFTIHGKAGNNGLLSSFIRLATERLHPQLYTGGTSISTEELSLSFAPSTSQTLMYSSPNPFSDQTVIHFALPHSCYTELCLFDISGQRLATVEGWKEKGRQTVIIDKSQLGLSEGIVICQLKTPWFVASEKLLLSAK